LGALPLTRKSLGLTFNLTASPEPRAVEPATSLCLSSLRKKALCSSMKDVRSERISALRPEGMDFRTFRTALDASSPVRCNLALTILFPKCPSSCSISGSAEERRRVETTRLTFSGSSVAWTR